NQPDRSGDFRRNLFNACLYFSSSLLHSGLARLESRARRRAAARVTGASMATNFPGESSEYRAARNKLLEAESNLRRQLEAVAALRRRLPAGGFIPLDYVFEEDASTVRLSQLFKPGHQSLIVYNFMFGPAMAKPCPMCTSILDALNGEAP